MFIKNKNIKSQFCLDPEVSRDSALPIEFLVVVFCFRSVADSSAFSFTWPSLLLVSITPSSSSGSTLTQPLSNDRQLPLQYWVLIGRSPKHLKRENYFIEIQFFSYLTEAQKATICAQLLLVSVLISLTPFLELKKT